MKKDPGTRRGAFSKITAKQRWRIALARCDDRCPDGVALSCRRLLAHPIDRAVARPCDANAVATGPPTDADDCRGFEHFESVAVNGKVA